MALAAPTMPEETWLAVFQGVLGEAPWPVRPLKITAVDTASGELTVWDNAGSASLVKAIASSCAVPGIFPPVTISGGRYMDGGVRSGTNADLAQGSERVLIIAPLGSANNPLGQRQLRTEAEALRAGRSEVYVVVPDQETLEAFGADVMDPSRQQAAIEAGVRQGQVLWEELARFWH